MFHLLHWQQFSRLIMSSWRGYQEPEDNTRSGCFPPPPGGHPSFLLKWDACMRGGGGRAGKSEDFLKEKVKETFYFKSEKKNWCLGGKNTAKQSLLCITVILLLGFPGGSDSKESTCNAGNLGSIPRLGIFPGEGNHYPLQYSGRQNFMDRGA